MVSVPTTGEVRKIWEAWHYRFNFESYEDSAERFDAWLAEHDREVKAEAWGEGFEAGELVGSDFVDWEYSSLESIQNPYRKNRK